LYNIYQKMKVTKDPRMNSPVYENLMEGTDVIYGGNDKHKTLCVGIQREVRRRKRKNI
jgi:hypothetical protein